MTHYELYELFRDNIPESLLKTCKDSKLTFDIMFIEIERQAKKNHEKSFWYKFLYRYGFI